MTQTAANEGRGAARFGRLASRALFVLGTAAAGTAAAWVISGAAASADTATTPSITPVTDATVHGMNEAARGVSQFAGDVSGTASAALREVRCHQEVAAWSMPSDTHPTFCSARDQIGGPAREHGARRALDHEVSERVSDSVADLAENAVVKPVQGTLGAVEHIARKPEDTRQVLDETFTPSAGDKDFGKKVWDLLNPNSAGDLVPLPQLPGTLPVGPGNPAENTAPAAGQTAGTTEAPLSANFQAAPAAPEAGSQQDPSNQDSNNSSRDDHRDFPFSPMQLPLAPVSIPTVPGGGNAPGGHFDGLTYGVPAWAVSAVDSAVAGNVRAGVRRMPLTPGSQPGVTPD